MGLQPCSSPEIGTHCSLSHLRNRSTLQPTLARLLPQELAAFLREDLPHLFDDQGIDASRYDDAVVFEDPITYYTNIKGEHLY